MGFTGFGTEKGSLELTCRSPGSRNRTTFRVLDFERDVDLDCGAGLKGKRENTGLPPPQAQETN